MGSARMFPRGPAGGSRRLWHQPIKALCISTWLAYKRSTVHTAIDNVSVCTY